MFVKKGESKSWNTVGIWQKCSTGTIEEQSKKTGQNVSEHKKIIIISIIIFRSNDRKPPPQISGDDLYWDQISKLLDLEDDLVVKFSAYLAAAKSCTWDNVALDTMKREELLSEQT